MLSGVQISDSAWGFKTTRPFPIGNGTLNLNPWRKSQIEPLQ